MGHDFEEFSSKNGQIISGANTSSTDLFFSGTWNSNTNSEVAANLILATFFGHFDEMLVIQDGEMTRHLKKKIFI